MPPRPAVLPARKADKPPVDEDLALFLERLLGFTPDLSQFSAAIIAELTQAFIDAYSSSYSTTGTAQPTGPTMVERAADYAQERAGELITDISEATQDGVKELVSQAVENGLSIGQLTNALRDYSGFGADRAETIARTETAMALGQGQKAAAVDMGQDEKAWQPGECDFCQGNADDGWIGIDETFSSGDDTIPAHPNCTCTVIFRTSRVHQAAPIPLVKEARCPQCSRWVGRNIPVGSEVFCPTHKAVRIVA